MITVDNFDSRAFDEHNINLVQKEIDGGTISTEQIVIDDSLWASIEECMGIADSSHGLWINKTK